MKNPEMSRLLILFTVIISFFAGAIWHKMSDTKQTVVAISPTPPPTPSPEPIQQRHLPTKGDQNAKIIIEEYADFRCPFCKKFFEDIEPKLIKDYVETGKAKFIFRHFEILGEESTKAGNAAECANEQNKFWPYHDYLYKNMPEKSNLSFYDTDNFISIASKLNLDSNQFKSCLENSKYDKFVSDDLSLGKQLGVVGTPTTFINGVAVSGAQPYEIFKTIIDQALSEK